MCIVQRPEFPYRGAAAQPAERAPPDGKRPAAAAQGLRRCRAAACGGRTKRQRVAGLRAGRLRPARHQEPQRPARVVRIRFRLRLPGNSAARNPRPARLEIAAAPVRIVRTRNPPHASGTSDRQSSLEKPQTPIPARKPDETPKHTAEQRTRSAPRSSGSSRATHARNNGISKRTGTSPRDRATGRQSDGTTRRRDIGAPQASEHRSIITSERRPRTAINLRAPPHTHLMKRLRAGFFRILPEAIARACGADVRPGAVRQPTMRLVSVSGKTIHGRNVLACSKSMRA